MHPLIFVDTTESNWQGICAAEGVVAERASSGRAFSDDRSGAENESRRLSVVVVTSAGYDFQSSFFDSVNQTIYVIYPAAP